jgi:hypothetical protein
MPISSIDWLPTLLRVASLIFSSCIEPAYP